MALYPASMQFIMHKIKFIMVPGHRKQIWFKKIIDPSVNTKWTDAFLRDLFFIIDLDLKIRPVARKGYGSIALEAKPNGLLTSGP